MSKTKNGITRREAIKAMGAAAPAFAGLRALRSLGLGVQEGGNSQDEGPFQATKESLGKYRVPEWFRDAKFGIWAHWGPQSSVEEGDWYARNMYIQGERQYEYHVKHYGHPSKFGYKDLIPLWKGERFDPNYLVGLYKKAGAKYFMSMGVHHDNFDMWDSKHQRWNAAKMGIRRDVVGEFRAAAVQHGLKFGVSDHLWISYKWFAVSHLADKTGPLAGVPYDGTNPKYADLYHEISDPKLLTDKLDWNEDGIPDSWKKIWYGRIQDLADRYQPDLLYSDGQLPFGDYGLRLLARFLNANAKRNGGRAQAVYTSKRKEDSDAGMCVLDRERGVLDEIREQPWQTDTCIGEWHYRRDITYKTPKTIVDMLVDIVSKNGNLMLNFPLPSSGMLDDRELKILEDITAWMNVNGEAIFATRPWKISGQAPSAAAASEDASFNEDKRKELTAEDVRFTTKGGTLYAFVMGWPVALARIAHLGSAGQFAQAKIERVELLGRAGALQWKREETGLMIELPEKAPSDYAVAFRILGQELA
ncbi:MAG TPA: alpha-L-fucosidase [Candidatus Acidoferrales bacterium]|nr:alpha-L-fucosidase [Candidatus Acidoferrales bacterium]